MRLNAVAFVDGALQVSGALGEELFVCKRTTRGVAFSRHIKSKVEEVEPGRIVCRIDVEEVHLNGNGTLHGGVYAPLIDNATGLSVAALVGFRTATIALDVHFLGAVRAGAIRCSAEVVHRTRRIATVEAKVRDAEGELVAMGTGTSRIFEGRGDPIVWLLAAGRRSHRRGRSWFARDRPTGTSGPCEAPELMAEGFQRVARRAFIISPDRNEGDGSTTIQEDACSVRRGRG